LVEQLLRRGARGQIDVGDGAKWRGFDGERLATAADPVKVSTWDSTSCARM